MTFEEKRVQSLALLAQTGIRPTVYAPPAVLLLWKLGVKVPPPHFMSFLSLASLCAVWYAPVWGLWMWIFVWFRQGKSVGSAATVACVAGLLFGLAMAVYYAWDRKKKGLPDWESIGETA
jgi:membrane associated rhomboid family serine protease